MASKGGSKTTFDPQRVIQPIYTGGGVALDRTGRLLASCIGEDVLFTDLSAGLQLGRVEGDGESVTSLAQTPSASHVIVCSRSLSMYIYSLRRSDDDSQISIIPELQKTLKPHLSPVITSAIDSTGTLLATGGSDGGVKVWDIRGGYVTHSFHGHSGIISALHFFEVSLEEQSLISEKNKRKGRRKSGDFVNGIDGSDVNLPQHTTGFRLASGGEDGKIRVWDLEKRKSIATLDSHVSIVRALDFCAEENVIVSASRDRTAIVWDVATWKVKRVLPVLELLESTGFLQAGKMIYTGGENGRLRLWESDSGRELTEEQEAANEGASIVDIISYTDLPFLLTVHADQSLLLHSLGPLSSFESGSVISPLPLIRRISGTHDEIIDLAYLTLDRSYLALATNSEDLRIISVNTTAAAPSENVSKDGWSGGNYFGADAALLQGHEDIIICLDTDWSGHWLATGAKDNTAKLWRIDADNNSFTCFATFTGHTESLGAVALPDSNFLSDSDLSINPLENPPPFLLTGSQDRTVKRWNIPGVTGKSPRTQYTRKAHDKDINSIAINHLSSLFASASQDRTVKIWSVEEGEVQGILRGHRRGVWSVRFAPKDAPSIAAESGLGSSSRGLVLTGSGDKTVKIWSLSDYSCLRTLEGHTNSVLKVLWLPPPILALDKDASSDGTPRRSVASQVASAGGDGLVKVWDATTGELACTLDNHTDRVWALAASPSPRVLVSAGSDSVINFWTDTTAETAAAAAANTSQLLEADQQLDNLTRRGSYREALILALTLSSAPSRLLSLLTAITSTSPPEPGSLTGVLAVDEVLASLAPAQLLALLRRVRDWNTNARTAPVAQKVLAVLVRSYPPDTWAMLRAGKGAQVSDVVAALAAYTERHYRRIEELVEDSYLVEFTLGEMDVVGVNGHVSVDNAMDGVVV